MPRPRTGASGILPRFQKPEALTVLDVRPYSWEEQLTAAWLQGLINRVKPRIYLVHDDVADRKWLDWCRRNNGIRSREARSFGELLRAYAAEVDGYAVCHEEMIHGGVHQSLSRHSRLLGRAGRPGALGALAGADRRSGVDEEACPAGPVRGERPQDKGGRKRRGGLIGRAARLLDPPDYVASPVCDKERHPVSRDPDGGVETGNRAAAIDLTTGHDRGRGT
jgi:hypothetical protein